MNDRWRRVGMQWQTFRRNRLALFGAAVLVLIAIVAAWPPLVTPHDPYEFGGPNAFGRLEAPSREHPFGTDELGRDLLSRVAYGTRISLLSALVVVAVAAVVGTVIGTLSASLASIWDDVVMRVADIFLAFPALVMAIVLVAFAGPGLQNALVALMVIWWPQYARLTRGTSLVVLQSAYMEAARSVGVPRASILRRHLLPNTLSPTLVKVSIDVSQVVLITGALSFLGLGAQPPSPELGALVNAGRQYLLTAWWYATLPGLVIFLIALASNLVGDGLREAIDPREN
jgi:peptide/nickel transport system permease protein